MKNIKYIIPARKNSKGLPFKNRILFKHTADLVRNFSNDVFVSSDDEEIKKMSKEYNFNFHERSSKNASSEATTKDFVREIVNDLNFEDETIVVMLMLTYPNRELFDIESCLNFFIKSRAKSLLCKKDINTTPYLMMFEKEGNLGEQVINHNLCRRQDYRIVFELCHFISIFEVSEIEKLNNNLYNHKTVYYKINKEIFDIDTIRDLELFNEHEQKNKNNS
jgi:CMP-N-acetylneuraminic acid synthetase